MRRKRVAISVLIAVIMALLALRLALPYLVTKYVNRTLQRIPEYTGSISGVDIQLLRGAYVIHELKLQKRGGKVPVPFLDSKTVDLSLQWNALFQGKVVGEVEFEHGALNFVSNPSSSRSQTHISDEWLSALKDLFPLRINRFGVKDFEVSYRDFSSTPNVNVKIKEVRIEGANLSNTRSPENSDKASIEAHGMVEGVSVLQVKATLVPAARAPTFKLRASVEKVPLVSLNDLFKAYGDFDVQEGTGAFYLLLSADDGALKGKLKPILKHLSVFSVEEDHDSLLQAFWELTVEGVSEVFTNHRAEQIATVVPIEGEMEHVSTDDWRAFVGVLRNAFFKAISPEWKSKG